MAISETPRTRAPRGTKSLTQAFFAALSEIPQDRRDVVAKAAQSAIREQLRVRRDKEKGARSTRGARSPNGSRQEVAAKPRGRPRRTRAADMSE